MIISRRKFLKTIGFSALVASCIPRIAFAAPNVLKSLRTGLQPGNKTRLVIETSRRPSYLLGYGTNQLIISVSNTQQNDAITPKIASGTLIKSLSQYQEGDALKIVATLNKSIDPIQKDQIMVLEPNGDNDYRLVFDFVEGVGTVGENKASSTVATTNTSSSRKYTIVIDPGHGGKDPGCIGKTGIKEKVVVLSIAQKLKTKLNALDFKTFLTRTSDVYLKLAERAEIAEKHHADLFISLHANANPSRSMKGFSIYTLSEKASDEEAQKLADSENAADKIDVDGFEHFSKDIRVALSALQQHAVAELSEEYAAGCAKSFNKADIEQQKGPSVRHAPFAVLKSTVPGALIELGHLSNASEEKLLSSLKYQDKLVDAIVKSIKNYDFDV